jgi:hypothetical protein
MDATQRKQTIALGRKAWDTLPHMSGLSMGSTNEKFLAMLVDDERGHRRFTDGPFGAGPTDSAKLMGVAWMARQLVNPKQPTWNDWLCGRQAAHVACALAEAHREEILQAWKAAGILVSELAEFDYAAFNE